MSKVELVHSSPIFRNPNPGYEHVTALFSHVVTLPGGELFCVYNRGQGMYATDLTFWQARSHDEGRSWVDHAPLTDRRHDDRPYSYHGPFLTRMHDGELVIAAFRVDRTDPQRPIFNEQTGGLTELEVILQRSADNGVSWSMPAVVTVPDGMVITPSSGVVELANGRCFLPYDQWHAFDDPGPYRPRTVGFFSSDKGQSWGDPVSFADGSTDGKGFWHGRITPLADRRLIGLFWSAVMDRAMAPLPLHRCVGSADGQTWDTPQATNIQGQTNGVVDLGDGRLAAVYTSREAVQPGFRVCLSEDGGLSWDLDNQLVVWDATGRERLGVEAPEAYPRSHDTIAYGAPTATLLPGHKILVSFWCTEMSITHVRCALLQVK
ncbi:MAG: exo-alpha-sialidase [Ardenticatenaceae bacterium]|nr:exo-alpha-sialidase [Ardenticatenaceae bacterium]